MLMMMILTTLAVTHSSVVHVCMHEHAPNVVHRFEERDAQKPSNFIPEFTPKTTSRRSIIVIAALIFQIAVVQARVQAVLVVAALKVH
jgi:hypothetical protein